MGSRIDCLLNTSVLFVVLFFFRSFVNSTSRNVPSSEIYSSFVPFLAHTALLTWVTLPVVQYLTSSMSTSSGTPLAKKLPAKLKEKLESRQFNYEVRSPASKRANRVADRHKQIVGLRQLRSASHNQRVKTSKATADMHRQLRSYQTLVDTQTRQANAEARRRAHLDDTATRAAIQNEASRQHAVSIQRLNQAKARNQELKQLHAQAVADKRRADYEFLKTQGAVIHNERVALTKDYVRMSDYFEEVTDDSHAPTEDEESVGRNILEADFGRDDDDDDDSDYIPDESSEESVSSSEDVEDQWSNAVFVGDDESYAESQQTRGSSTGYAAWRRLALVAHFASVFPFDRHALLLSRLAAGNDGDLGRSLLVAAYSPLFRRQVITSLLAN